LFAEVRGELLVSAIFAMEFKAKLDWTAKAIPQDVNTDHHTLDIEPPVWFGVFTRLAEFLLLASYFALGILPLAPGLPPVSAPFAQDSLEHSRFLWLFGPAAVPTGTCRTYVFTSPFFHAPDRAKLKPTAGNECRTDRWRCNQIQEFGEGNDVNGNHFVNGSSRQ
jgi:hypothetical protein